MTPVNTPFQRISAPLFILIVILLLWEGLVAYFQIEQFLLPRPSAILANLVQIVAEPATDSSSVASINQILPERKQLIVQLDQPLTNGAGTQMAQIRFFSVPVGSQILHLVEGQNLRPVLQASWFTLKEALGGLIIGGTAGVFAALVTARWSAVREALLPFAIAANSMPIIAFAPIMNNWFGIDNPFSKMAIVAMMVFFPIMLNTVRGLVSTDTNSLELMRSYAASDLEILQKLRIPTALPYFFSGLKVAAALSMIGAIVGEYFGGPRIALGVFITQEAALFRFASAWAAILMACLMGIALYLIVLLFERLAMPWHVSIR